MDTSRGRKHFGDSISFDFHVKLISTNDVLVVYDYGIGRSSFLQQHNIKITHELKLF